MCPTDSVYLSSVMGRPLALCLQELTEVRPRDPIEWMAHWLYKWRDSQATTRHSAKLYKDLVRTEKAIRREAVSRSDKIRTLKRTTDPKRSIFVDRLYHNRRQSKRNDRDDSIARKRRRTKRKVSYGTDSDETDESSETVTTKRMKKQRKRYFDDTAAAAEEDDEEGEEEELYVKTKSKKRKHDKRKKDFDDKEGEEEVEEEVDLKKKSKRRKRDKRRREVDDKNDEKEEAVDLKTTSRKRKYAKRRSHFDDKDEEEVDLQKTYKKRKHHKRMRDFDDKDVKDEEEPDLQKESKEPKHDTDYSYECSSDSDSSLIFDAQNKRWMDYVDSDDDDSDRLKAKRSKKEQETNIRDRRRPPGPSGSGRPSVARWAVTSRLTLVCHHPVLGDLQPRPAIVYPETPDWWHRQGYLPRTLYDHEVYSNANEDTIKNWDNMEHMSYKEFITSGPWLSGCLQNATASYRALVHVPRGFSQHLSEEVKAELAEDTRKISKKKLKAVKKESKRDAQAVKISTSGS